LPGSRCSRTGRWRSNARDLEPQLVKINCGVRGLQVPIWRVRTCPNGSSMLLPRALRPTEYIGRSLPLSDETVHHLDLGRGSHRTWSWTLDLQTVVEAWYLRGTIPSDDPRSSIARAATPVNDNTARRSRLRYIRCGTLGDVFTLNWTGLTFVGKCPRSVCAACLG
jgi:hypothetical protein